MDDRAKGIFPSIILCIGIAISIAGHALDFEYVSPEQREALEREFRTAKIPAASSIKNKRWACDMYGMRTHLQVKRDVRLYHFKDEGSWHNNGAQVIRNYRVDDSSLVGQTDRFEDRVKVNAKGELVSRLSAVVPERHVVAYSICKSI